MPFSLNTRNHTEKLDELDRELTAAEANRIQKEAKYKLMLSGNPELIAGIDSNSLLSKLQQQQSDLRVQIAQAQVQLGPAHPRIRELNSQLQQVQSSLKTEVDKLAGRIKSDYDAASKRESLLRGAMESQKQQANKVE